MNKKYQSKCETNKKLLVFSMYKMKGGKGGSCSVVLNSWLEEYLWCVHLLYQHIMSLVVFCDNKTFFSSTKSMTIVGVGNHHLLTLQSMCACVCVCVSQLWMDASQFSTVYGEKWRINISLVFNLASFINKYKKAFHRNLCPTLWKWAFNK